MKPSERVLLPNGQFAAFPERLEERAIETGAKDRPAAANKPDPNLPREDKAKREVEAKHDREEAEKKAKEEALNPKKRRGPKPKKLDEDMPV